MIIIFIFSSVCKISTTVLAWWLFRTWFWLDISHFQDLCAIFGVISISLHWLDEAKISSSKFAVFTSQRNNLITDTSIQKVPLFLFFDEICIHFIDKQSFFLFWNSFWQFRRVQVSMHHFATLLWDLEVAPIRILPLRRWNNSIFNA